MANASAPIHVLVVAESALMRAGLRALLQGQCGIQIVGEARAIVEGIHAVLEQRVDVVIVDVPTYAHVDLQPCEKLKNEGLTCHAIIVTGRTDDKTILDLIMSGGSGYLLEDVTADELAEAVRTVHAGGTPVDPKVASVAVGKLRAQLLATPSPWPLLTIDEYEVLTHIVLGKTNCEIGRALHLEDKFVRHCVSAILRKVGAKNRVAAAAYWAHHNQMDTKRTARWQESVASGEAKKLPVGIRDRGSQ